MWWKWGTALPLIWKRWTLIFERLREPEKTDRHGSVRGSVKAHIWAYLAKWDPSPIKSIRRESTLDANWGGEKSTHKWIKDIQNTPQPGTKKEVWSFLGLIGWYQKFVPQFQLISQPWSARTQLSSPVIRSPEFIQMFPVSDAWSVGLGGVLAQGERRKKSLYLSLKPQSHELDIWLWRKRGWPLSGF